MKLGSSEVVVIGAGVRGTSIAYHLARAGVSVTVLDKAFICSGASGATFALINVSGKPPAEYTALSLASADLYPGLSEELDCDLEYERGNQIYTIIEREEDVPAARAYAEQMSSVPGVSVTFLSPDEVRELEPAVSPAIAGGLLCHQDGHLNPFKLTFGYARAATRLGARFLPYHEVTAIRVSGGRVCGVVTPRGEISCRWVVNAAGIDVPAIGAMVGVEIPVVACRGQVVTTQPLPGLLRQPLGSLKPNKAGPILIGTTNEFVGPDRSVEVLTMAQRVARAIRIVPALAQAQMIRAWAGLRPWPIDGLPILGPVPEVEGFLIATGHSGYTLAQITGKLITELITRGTTSTQIQSFSVTRFRDGRFHFGMYAFRTLQRREAERPTSVLAG